ncbi:MAG: malate dehydrogenase [Pseudomonadota bacterium]|nr:malate dehydrogenase [Pseudomonadota bacterium]
MKTIAITGAGGQIGYALVFRVLSFFSDKGEKINLKLIDLTPVMPSMEGLAMEIDDCAFSCLNKLTVTDDLREGFKDIDWAFLVGAMPRQKGMERADLLEKNAMIFKEQGEALNEVANPNAHILVVGNPCNTNALIASHYAPNLNKKHFYGMMMLDELRARAQVANKLDVQVEDVNNMIVWGNHSATQFADFTNAYVNDNALLDLCDEVWLKETFIPTNQKRGAAVIAARGASSAASAANAALETMKRIEYPDGKPFSLGICSDGEYGAKPGLMVSYPCIMDAGELKVIDDISLDSYVADQAKLSFDELASEYDQLKALNII